MSYLFDFYARFYDTFMSFFSLDNNSAILSFIDDEKLSICDIGGGTGVLANELIQKGHKVTIIDSSKKMMQIAKNRNSLIKIIHAILPDVEGEGIYDIIILKDTLHHIKKQDATLKTLDKLLKNNGKIIIQEFLPSSNVAKVLFFFEFMCFEKVYPIKPETLYQKINSYGFSPIFQKINKFEYIIYGVKIEK